MALDSLTFGFLYALGIGLVVATILLIVFCWLRRRVPEVFYHRRLLNTWKSYDDFNGKRVGLTLPAPADSFLGWLKPVLFTSEDQIYRKIGLDAVVFLRFIRTALIIVAILAFFSVAMLMPVYGTAENRNLDSENENFVEGLKIISLGNVSENQTSRLWATVIMEYITAIVVVYFMVMDYSHYTDLRRKYRVSENPTNYALAIFDIPPDSRNETAVRERFEPIVPGQIAEVIMVRRCGKAMKLQKKLDQAVMKRELAEYIESVKGVSPQTRPGFCGCCMCHKPKVDALEYWKEEQERLAKEIEEDGGASKQCSSAILLLANKRAAAVLAQANSATNATEWTIERTPEPDAVHWPAFGVPGYQAEVRSFSVSVFMVFFTLFWTIPATFIVGLFSLQKLTSLAAFEWLSFILEWNEAIVALIEGLLPPILMSVLISLIPVLFRFVVSQERLISRAIIERKTRDYFYFFTIYGSFFVIVLGQAFLEDLDKIIEEPTTIVDQLAINVPASGVFYATFILLECLIPFPLLLSNLVRTILRCIFLKLAKTERQKRKARTGSNLFQYFRFSGNAMLILFLCIMYSSMSPIVLVAGLFYFGFAFVVFRYQVLYATHQPWDGGGFLFTGSFWGTMIALMLKQLVVFGVMGLREAAPQAILTIILFAVTLLFSLLVKKRFASLSDHGSLHDLYAESSKLDEIPGRYHGIYDQPAGKITYYENLNGLEGVELEVYSEASYDEDENHDGLHSEHHDENVGYVPDRAAEISEA